MALRCLIVDDNAHFLDAARGLLDGEDITVVGVASTSDEALRRTGELHPDIVLVDIDLGEESGFDVARQLIETAPDGHARVILISTYAESDFADLIAESSAVGFLPKSDLSRQAIHELLRRSAAGERPAPP